MLAVLGRHAAQTAPAAVFVAARHICNTTAAAGPKADELPLLRQFLDAPDPENASNGRSWKASELRNKSFDDLHKLWYICLKERNMLLTQMSWESRWEHQEGQLSRKKESQLKRYVMAKKTMNRIKQVLSERACNEADAVKAADMKRVIHYM